jgi:hypothetical protein
MFISLFWFGLNVRTGFQIPPCGWGRACGWKLFFGFGVGFYVYAAEMGLQPIPHFHFPNLPHHPKTLISESKLADDHFQNCGLST